MRTCTSLVLALLCAPLAAQGNTYFVDAKNGSDLNSGGSRVLAFKSLTFAISKLTDDDRLIVLPGTYSPDVADTAETLPIQLGVLSQKRVRIIGEQGPAVTIFDGKGGAINSGIPMMRCRWDADGSSITGITFQNTGNADYWSMVFRLGSTSGGPFAAQNIEIYGCVFKDVHRAVVVFGTDPVNANQTTGIKFHDNLIVNATGRAIALWGDGNNAAYNNTIVNGAIDSIYVDALFGQNTAATIVNNLVHKSPANGITVGTTNLAPVPVILNNNAFGNLANYQGFTPDPSNTSVDPLFVNEAGNDFHLTSSSPVLQNGNLGLPTIRHDLDRFSRAHDSDQNGQAGIDRGAYQFTRHTMVVSGEFAPGKALTFDFKGPNGLGALFFGLRSGALYADPYGVVLFDPLTLIVDLTRTVPVPGQILFVIPPDPTLLGLTLATQGGWFEIPSLLRFHLLNVYENTL
jgi:hypothetical protein